MLQQEPERLLVGARMESMQREPERLPEELEGTPMLQREPELLQVGARME